MKTQIFASIIIGILSASAAQAGSAPTIEETYSPSQLSAASRYDISSYYKMPQRQQQVAKKATCSWQVAQYDLNPLRVVYTEEATVESNYLASPNLHLVC